MQNPTSSRIQRTGSDQTRKLPVALLSKLMAPQITQITYCTNCTDSACACRRAEGPDEKEPQEACGLPFVEYTENTDRMRELCPTERCCAYIAAKDRWVPHFVDVHIADQAHCMFLPDGSPLVDYIGASESLDEDWPQVCSLPVRAHALAPCIHSRADAARRITCRWWRASTSVLARASKRRLCAR